MAAKTKLVTLSGRSSTMLVKSMKMTLLWTWMLQRSPGQPKKNRKHHLEGHLNFSSRTTSNGSYTELFSVWEVKPCSSYPALTWLHTWVIQLEISMLTLLMNPSMLLSSLSSQLECPITQHCYWLVSMESHTSFPPWFPFGLLSGTSTRDGVLTLC